MQLKPGLHDLTFEEYQRVQAASNSLLGELLRSPAHCYEKMIGEEKRTDATIIGQAIHTAILEPKRFAKEYASLPEKFDGRKKEFKDLKAEFLKSYSPEKILKHAEYESILTVKKSVLSKPLAARFLKSLDYVEKTAFWFRGGVPCKARFDGVSLKLNAIVDVKSTTDASAAAFIRSIENYGYYRQAAHYIDGARACGLEVTRFVIIAVEKESPYESAVYLLEKFPIGVGRQELDKLVPLFGKCLKENSWPGYPEEVVTLSGSDWLANRSNEKLRHVAFV